MTHGSHPARTRIHQCAHPINIPNTGTTRHTLSTHACAHAQTGPDPPRAQTASQPLFHTGCTEKQHGYSMPHWHSVSKQVPNNCKLARVRHTAKQPSKVCQTGMRLPNSETELLANSATGPASPEVGPSAGKLCHTVGSPNNIPNTTQVASRAHKKCTHGPGTVGPEIPIKVPNTIVHTRVRGVPTVPQVL